VNPSKEGKNVHGKGETELHWLELRRETMGNEEVKRQEKQQHLEKLMAQTQAWLLREDDNARPREIYDEDMLTRYGPNLMRDEYVRIVRKVAKYFLDGENV